MSDDIFGEIIDADSVEQAVKGTLERWIDNYLTKMEVVKGYPPNEIQRPLGIVTSSEFDNWPGDQIPVYLIVNAGLVGKPTRRGDSSYEAAWAIGIAPVVSDVDQGQTRRLAATHAAAIRAALSQHKALASDLYPDGFAKSVKWEGESYSDLPFIESRSLGSMRVTFSVGVADVVTEQAGPRVPIPTPPNGELPPSFPTVVPGGATVTTHLDSLVGAPT